MTEIIHAYTTPLRGWSVNDLTWFESIDWSSDENNTMKL